MAEGTKTVCPYCGVGCGVIATQLSDGSVDIRGDDTHPANFGRLCSKGSALGETMSLDDRLLEPEIDGQLATWDSALDLVARRFEETISEYGPDSVAFYVSGQILTEDYYVANKLMKGFIGSANIDTNSRLCMASSVAGHRRAFGSDTVPGTYEDLELADVIVLVGSNLAWCHPVLYQRIVAARANRPNMKVVLIDPRKTMTADIADLHLAIAPDGDVALFAGLLNHLSEQGAINTAYVAHHTNGFPDALAAAHAATLSEVSQITGLTQQQIGSFYDLWSRHEKVVTVYSQGVNQSALGTDKVNAILNCHLATGRIGRPGMGPFSITGQPNAMGGREVGGLANMLAAHMALENSDDRDRVQRFWNAPNIADKPGLKAIDMFDAVAEGKIRAIWIMATNPVDSLPDGDQVAAALKECPFVVVSDVVENNDTLKFANVKLPSLAWGEKDGTVTNSERRISRQKAFLPAPGSAKADWWQMAEVARRMGFAEAFDFESAASIFREYAAQTAFENNGTRDLDIGAMANVDDHDYADLSPFQWPKPLDQIALNDEKRFFSNGGFFTNNRLASFVPVAVQRQLETVNKDYVLNTGRIRDQWHTMTRTGKSPRLSSHIAEPFAEIHPADAQALGIADAELVRMSNGRGEIIVRSLISDRVQRGQTFVPMHFNDQQANNARVNKLVRSAVDPISGQPALKSSLVKVLRFDAAQYGFIVSRNRPVFANASYWALARVNEGWRAEFASQNPSHCIETAFREMADIDASVPALAFSDQALGLVRIAAFEGDVLLAAAFISTEPVAVSRSWAIDQMRHRFTDLATRWRIVAGRPADDVPDKGAIVCSCMGVGSNEIAVAVKAGCRSVGAVGKATTAGSNCGSCQSEIRAIIDEHQIVAAE